jgi:hypothetical protein
MTSTSLYKRTQQQPDKVADCDGLRGFAGCRRAEDKGVFSQQTWDGAVHQVTLYSPYSHLFLVYTPRRYDQLSFMGLSLSIRPMLGTI